MMKGQHMAVGKGVTHPRKRAVSWLVQWDALPLAKVRRIREIFEETRNYSETARRVGVASKTVRGYVGKGKGKLQQRRVSGEEIWRTVLELGGNLSEAARRLGYRHTSAIGHRLKRMGKMELLRVRYPLAKGVGVPKRLNFQRDLWPHIQEMQGSVPGVAKRLKVSITTVWRMIERAYPRGGSFEERRQAFREDFPNPPVMRSEVQKPRKYRGLPLEKVEKMRKIFEETRSYTKTAKQMGVYIKTAIKYIGKGKAKERIVEDDEEVWRVATEVAQGNLAKTARILGYRDSTTLMDRIKRLGRAEEFYKRYRAIPKESPEGRQEFEEKMLPELKKTRGNVLWASEELGISTSGLIGRIRRYYPEGGGPKERYHAFRRDYPVHEIQLRDEGFEPEESSLAAQSRKIGQETRKVLGNRRRVTGPVQSLKSPS
jgi:predicted DNA-binding protein (UPF0251 family)